MASTTALLLAYPLLAVFAVAFVLRTLRIARMPVHLRWELAPVPKEGARSRYGGSYLEEYEWWKQPRRESRLSELRYMLSEIVFLKALWEHNRRLWWFSFPFHVGLYLLCIQGGLVVVSGVVAVAGASGTAWGVAASPAVRALALVACGLGAVGAAGIIVSRLVEPGLRATTTPVALFNLLFLLGVCATGFWAFAAVPRTSTHLVAFVQALLTGRAIGSVPLPVALYLGSSLFLLAYLPFSQMMHFVAKYFTYHQVRWDDRPLVAGGRMEREVERLLNQPVTWAGPHVGADGRKNWADIASDGAEK